MILSAIVAVSDNNAIGRDNQLPWHLPEDLKFFKRTTLGKPVLMGRKTFESLGRPLPGRLNIVVSTQKNLVLPEGVLLFHNIDDAVARLEQENTEEAFIIGGGTIYEQTMSLLDRMYITQVHTTILDAHAFYPHADHTHWKMVWHEDHKADEKHAFDFTFQQWERINEI
jgi:dihydrofolate reductase